MKAGYYWIRPKTAKQNEPIVIAELSEWGQWWRCGHDAAEWEEPEVLSDRLEEPQV